MVVPIRAGHIPHVHLVQVHAYAVVQVGAAGALVEERGHMVFRVPTLPFGLEDVVVHLPSEAHAFHGSARAFVLQVSCSGV